MSDARFEDGAEKPLRLQAVDAESLEIIAALCQDAIFPASEISFSARKGEFAVLLNRFRWEHASKAGERPAERVQSVLKFDTVRSVKSDGVERGNADQILSLLTIKFTEIDAPSGVVELVLAGDGGVRLDVEALEVSLIDVTKPYLAPSRKTPQHPE